MLCHDAKLAKTSQKPGKTLLINHFLVESNDKMVNGKMVNDKWHLVDLPGYGYAQAGQKQREALRKMIERYCLLREQLVCLFVLIDCRHEPQKIDMEFINWLGEKGVPFALVFTKGDKLGKVRLRENVEAYKNRLLEDWEELPPVFVTSAETGLGGEELTSYIEELKALEDLNGENYKDLYDEPLMDYLKKPLDGLTGKERAQQHAINKTVGRVHQAMEAFIHNMNTIHSRGGNQVVFSSINYGTDTSAEGRCIMREILLSTYEGVGGGETAIFPIQIWKKKRGVNYLPEDRNFDLYQLACKVTARRFFPNFLNLDATYNQDPDWRADDPKRYIHEVATMGCRTRVFENRFGPRTSIGRGNISFSTINIVKLAIECMEEPDQQKRIDMFFAKLDNMLEITAKQLDDRFQFQKTAFTKQFPLLMKSLWIGADKLGPNDTIESVINQGTLGIGFIGLAECLVALTGKHHGESAESQELGLKIIEYMRQRVNDFCERYHHNYSVLATPAEGLSGKFTKKDRLKFGSIPGVTDRDYYTNSNHVPVYYKCSARHKAEIEAPYHEITRGGHIFYVEIDGDATHNPQVIMSVVDMMDQLNMGYGSVNHNRNRCMDCGYENADDHLEKCPKCGSANIDKLQRITGYLVGTTDRWNSGKLAELNDRVTHIDHGTKDLFSE